MKRRSFAFVCSLLFAAPFASGRNVPGDHCGTYPARAPEELARHHRSVRARVQARLRAGAKGPAAAALREREALLASARATNKDYGNIAVIDDAGGVVATNHLFNLDEMTVRFTPANAAAGAYGVSHSAGGYDSGAASAGQALAGLGDDDSRSVPLPFAFPFYGKSYRSVWVNSDGNLTFQFGDAASTDRSLGRMTAGPARIAPLFSDLDPSQAGAGHGVKVSFDALKATITWDAIPQYGQFGTGPIQNFQVRLFADGRIEFTYHGMSDGQEAVVGIAPGGLAGSTTIADFAAPPSGQYSGAIADRFTSGTAVDIATTAQKFYATHDDAYDYLVIYNALGTPASTGAVAYEVTTRNDRTGYGDDLVDTGVQFGSARRLQSVINAGPLDQYPIDPNAHVQSRGPTLDTPTTVIAHETGHLFLAFVSVPDPNDPNARPMLNPRNLVHWAFNFNSEASLLEGNRVEDTPGGSPEFRTNGNVEHYAPLDQYLMGLRSPDEVPTTFVVLDPVSASGRAIHGYDPPQSGVSFGGKRLDVHIQDIVDAAGRRTPDHTVSQRRFRFAFILIVHAGDNPSADQLSQLEGYRSSFEQFFAKASDNRASADATLKRAVQFSGSPAVGVLAGSSALATVSVASPVPAPLTIHLTRASSGAAGAVSAPGSVTIPAGSTSASFSFTGARPGVDELALEPADTTYETVYARIQVLASQSGLTAEIASGDRQTATFGPLPDPIAIRVVDMNRLPYPGVTVRASVSAGGSLDAASAVTDESGIARFRWTPAPSDKNTFTATIPGSASSVSAVALGLPAFKTAGVVNAASFAAGVTPGGIATIFGSNLAAGQKAAAQSLPLPFTLGGIQVLVDGAPASLYYVSDTQINFVMPQSAADDSVDLKVSTPAAVSAEVEVHLEQQHPGVFFNPANQVAAATVQNTALTTDKRAAAAGEYIAIFLTGLGSTHQAGGYTVTDVVPKVTIGGVEAQVSYSGMAPGYPGLYQINAFVPAGVASGPQTLIVTANGIASNATKLILQ